ncbi:50S ribosomal protein L3 [bacterium]|jgi:large subunit ribosomal protein L3|nr:50S ribosomal protein L3 [bacterium]
MLRKIYGVKVGMTQLFDAERKLIPVTAVRVTGWFVTQVKTQGADGYDALQVGCVRNRLSGVEFQGEWLFKKKRSFRFVKEIKGIAEGIEVGKPVGIAEFGASEGDEITVAGTSRGLGFQGCIKRWGFSRGPMSHGSGFHRSPGSMGGPCSLGGIQKGKKLPGHTGAERITVRGLRVIRIDSEQNCIFIKGAVPGKSGSLVEIAKQGPRS